MLEIVFSESAKNTMRMAKNYDNKTVIGGHDFYAYKNQKILTSTLKTSRNNISSRKSNDVICIGFSLDIGDISGEIDSRGRREVFRKVLGCTGIDEQEIERFFRLQRKDLVKLISAATQGIPIRVWESHAPFSVCGFAFVCNVLRNIECTISVISFPEQIINTENTNVSYRDWNEVPPEQLYDFLSYEHILTTVEKRVQSDLWRNLKIENSPLRAVINDSLISVPEDFYDHLILRNLPDNEFMMETLIGELLHNYQIGISDGWYALRIEKMIQKQQIKVITKSNPRYRYRQILKKVKI